MNSVLSKVKHLPLTILFLITLLSSIGLVLMYDASGGSFGQYFIRQLVSMLVFGLVMIFISCMDLRVIIALSYYAYVISLVFVLMVSFAGHRGMGAVRWIDLGIIRFQPSEIMKIGVVLALGKYFASISDKNTNQFIYLLLPCALIILPTAFIMKQPDLGTAMVILIVSIIILFLAGVNVRKFLIAGVAVGSFAPVIWNYLYDYQKKRILTFLNPENDPLGSGYNIIQSQIAIGSGGLFGKGRLSSTQAKLDFLPESHTDFIFPLFSEQFGFVGSLLLIIIFALLALNVFYIGIQSKSVYGRLVIFGLGSIFVTHIIINIGMVMGLLPVVGIPLPFISYGRTSIGTMLIAFGIIMNISLNNRSRAINTRGNYII